MKNTETCIFCRSNTNIFKIGFIIIQLKSRKIRFIQLNRPTEV